MLSTIAALALTGCVPYTSNGMRHIVVLGFGIVSVPSATNAPGTQVTKTQAIGLVLSDQPGIKAGIGYSSSLVTQVAPNQNVAVEVSKAGEQIKISPK